MALDVSKLRQQEQVQATGNNPAASTSASSSSQPIDMKTGTMTPEEKQAKVLEFIKSGEFKECPDEQKIELLKQQFPDLAELSEKDLAKYIAEAINTLPAEENIEAVKTFTKTFGNELAVKTVITKLTAETATTAAAQIAETTEANVEENTQNTSTDKPKTKKQTRLEELANKYCAENNLKDATIDDIIRSINSKKQAGENLTEDEKAILAAYNTREKKVISPETKLELKTLAYLKNDDKYKNLSPEEKKEYKQYCLAKFITLSKLDAQSTEKENENEKQAFLRARNLIQTAIENNLSLEQIEDMRKNNPAELEALMYKPFEENLKRIYNNSDDTTKYDKLMDKILTYSSADYNCIEDEADKEAYRKDSYNALIQDTFNVKLETLDEETAALYTDVFFQYLDSVITKPNVSPQEKISQLSDLSQKDRLDLMQKTIEQNPNIPQEQKDELCEKTTTAIRRLEIFGEEEISDTERIEILEKLKKEGKLHAEDEAYLDELKIRCEIDEESTKEVSAHDNCMSNSDIATAQNLEFNTEYLKNTYPKFDKGAFVENSPIYNEFKQMVHQAIHAGSEEKKEYELKVIEDFLTEQNVDKKVIDNLFSDKKIYTSHLAKALVCAGPTAAINTGAKAVANLTQHGVRNRGPLPPELHEISRKATNIYTKRNEKNTEAIDTFSEYVQDNERVRNDFTKAIYENFSEENTNNFFERMSKSDKITEANTAAYTESFIENVKNDEEKIKFADTFSKFGNSAIIEGLAAGADSVQDKNYRNQYSSVVTEAAKNYPPEVQQTIQTVLTTGQISEETKNSTAPATSSYYPEADTYTPQSTNSNSNRTSDSNTNTYNTNTNHHSQTTTQTSQGVNPTPHIQNEVYTPNNYQQNPSSKDFATPDSQSSTRSYNNTTSSDEISNHSVSSTATPKFDSQEVKIDAAVKQAEANQQMKDLALENVAEVKQQIDESIAEWELKQELKLTDEVISELKEVAASEALEEFIEANPSKKDEVLEKLSNADSISEVYDILLSALGSKVHTKFIDNLARAGSIGNIKAFLESKAGNSDVIKQILLRTTSTTLKNELIGMLPESDILELLDKNLLTTLDNVDHDIIFTYVSKNIYSMTQTNFANFLKYLPFDEREKLITMRNKALGNDEKQKAEQQVEVQTNPITQNQQNQTLAYTKGIGATKANSQQHPQANAEPKVGANTEPKVEPKTEQQENKTPQNKNNQNNTELAENPQTRFKAGETVKVLNDGRIITTQGTTFAGISNNVEEGYKVVDPNANKKNKDGSPIGMNDDVLTPGSPEWLRKYNRQAPTTAFTMAALEEQAENDGLNFGSNRVKIGQSIKKKYNPNGFNIRG